MEKRICKHINCTKEFLLKRNDKQFCSRVCKEKSYKMSKYHNDIDYKNMKLEASEEQYAKVLEEEKKWMKPISELTEEQIEHLKSVKGEDHHWFQK